MSTSAPHQWPTVVVIATAMFFVTVAHASLPAVPSDQNGRDEAQELGERGVEAYANGDWEQSRQLFHRAYQLVPAPTLAIREADALVKLGRLVEARETYSRVMQSRVDDQSPSVFRLAVKRAAVELRDLDPLVPRLTVTLPLEDRTTVRVLVDGKVMDEADYGRAQMIDPGKHHVEVLDRTGRLLFERSVELATGEHEEVVAIVEEAPELPRSSTQQTIGWTSLAVGGAGAAIGITTGILAARHQGNLEEQCTNDVCPPSAQGDLDAYRSLRSASFVGYGVGLAGLGLGATLLLMSGVEDAGAKSESAGIRPWVGSGSAGLGGRF
jgi:hypothetical protein